MNPLSLLPSRIYDAALSLVYPQSCAVCGDSVESRDDGVACAACWDATHLFQANTTLCWKCGALSGAKVKEAQRSTVRCGRCADDAFTVARACGHYEGALRASILELKRRPHVGGRLARLINEMQRREPLDRTELIVPVPLHPSRERERGFNQALQLARALAALGKVPLEEHVLVRLMKTTMHRAGMDGKARRQSVANAFEVRHPDLIAGKIVLLIDDVFTTGATVSECAAALKNAGVAEVFVLTVARAA